MAIGQAPVVKYLEQGIEYIGMGLFDLVQQDDAVGAPPHRFGKLSPLLKADIARRGADKAGYGMFFLVL